MTLFIILLLIGKGIYCALAAMPSRFFTESFAKLKSIHSHHVQSILESALARSARDTDFHADESFLPKGLGLAADYQHRSFFIAERDGSQTKAAILPFSALRGYVAGSVNQNGFYDEFIDLKVEGEPPAQWRLLCGDNAALTAEVTEVLGRLQAA